MFKVKTNIFKCKQVRRTSEVGEKSFCEYFIYFLNLGKELTRGDSFQVDLNRNAVFDVDKKPYKVKDSRINLNNFF